MTEQGMKTTKISRQYGTVPAEVLQLSPGFVEENGGKCHVPDFGFTLVSGACDSKKCSLERDADGIICKTVTEIPVLPRHCTMGGHDVQATKRCINVAATEFEDDLEPLLVETRVTYRKKKDGKLFRMKWGFALAIMLSCALPVTAASDLEIQSESFCFPSRPSPMVFPGASTSMAVFIGSLLGPYVLNSQADHVAYPRPNFKLESVHAGPYYNVQKKFHRFTPMQQPKPDKCVIGDNYSFYLGCDIVDGGDYSVVGCVNAFFGSIRDFAYWLAPGVTSDCMRVLNFLATQLGNVLYFIWYYCEFCALMVWNYLKAIWVAFLLLLESNRRAIAAFPDYATAITLAISPLYYGCIKFACTAFKAVCLLGQHYWEKMTFGAWWAYAISKAPQVLIIGQQLVCMSKDGTCSIDDQVLKSTLEAVQPGSQVYNMNDKAAIRRAAVVFLAPESNAPSGYRLCGTGVVLNVLKDGQYKPLLVTAAHVSERATKVAAALDWPEKMKVLDAPEFETDKENDMAWCFIKPAFMSNVRADLGTSLAPAKIDTARLKKNMQVSSSGPVCPKDKTFGYFGSWGIITGASKEFARYGFIHKASTVAGWSGSPITNSGQSTVYGVHLGCTEENGATVNHGVDLRQVLVRNGVIDDGYRIIKQKEGYYSGEDDIDFEEEYDDEGGGGRKNWREKDEFDEHARKTYGFSDKYDFDEAAARGVRAYGRDMQANEDAAKFMKHNKHFERAEIQTVPEEREVSEAKGVKPVGVAEIQPEPVATPPAPAVDPTAGSSKPEPALAQPSAVSLTSLVGLAIPSPTDSGTTIGPEVKPTEILSQLASLSHSLAQLQSLTKQTNSAMPKADGVRPVTSPSPKGTKKLPLQASTSTTTQRERLSPQEELNRLEERRQLLSHDGVQAGHLRVVWNQKAGKHILVAASQRFPKMPIPVSRGANLAPPTETLSANKSDSSLTPPASGSESGKLSLETSSSKSSETLVSPSPGV